MNTPHRGLLRVTYWTYGNPVAVIIARLTNKYFRQTVGPVLSRRYVLHNDVPYINRFSDCMVIDANLF